MDAKKKEHETLGEMAQRLGITCEDLNKQVLAASQHFVSRVNNSGVDIQLEYLEVVYDSEHVRAFLIALAAYKQTQR